MARNWLLAHWKRIAMQVSLCGLLLAALGLAGFVVHAKRLALRLPLTSVRQFGRLGTMLPRGWSTPATTEHHESGDVVQSEEIVPEPLTGRKLSVRRVPATGLMPPLDFLVRAGTLTPKDLTGTDPGSKEKPGPTARVQPLEVAGWPGVMVTHTALAPSGRRSLKSIVACAVLPQGQAVVIKLDGVGPPDAADEELVRQIAEVTRVYVAPTGEEKLLPEPGDASVELDDGIHCPIPAHFAPVRAETDRLSRELLADAADGRWTSVELIPCLWLDGDPKEQFLTMLVARDRSWHSGEVKPLGDNGWRADRVPLAGELPFPARAYCLIGGGHQALVAVMRGGWREDSAFDPAWAAIWPNLLFRKNTDLPALLARGAAEATEMAATGLNAIFAPKPLSQNWVLWNAAENVDRQDWMTLKVARAEWNADAWRGDRNPAAAAAPPGFALGDVTFQSWNGTSDLSTYSVRTDSAVSVRGETNARRATQRFDLRDGKLMNVLSTDDPRPVPPQYVPGGWLPLLLGRVGDGPMVLRTESFLACDGSAPPGLLTVLVARARAADGANCVTASVNGTGRVTRFWYNAAGVLNQIDLGSGLRAQGIDVANAGSDTRRQRDE